MWHPCVCVGRVFRDYPLTSDFTSLNSLLLTGVRHGTTGQGGKPRIIVWGLVRLFLSLTRDRGGQPHLSELTCSWFMHNMVWRRGKKPRSDLQFKVIIRFFSFLVGWPVIMCVWVSPMKSSCRHFLNIVSSPVKSTSLAATG